MSGFAHVYLRNQCTQHSFISTFLQSVFGVNHRDTIVKQSPLFQVNFANNTTYGVQQQLPNSGNIIELSLQSL